MHKGALQLSGRAPGPAELLSSRALISLWAGLAIGALLVLGFAAYQIGGLAGLAWRLSCVGYAAVCLLRGVDWRQARALWMIWLPFLLGVIIDAVVLHTPASAADLVRQLFIFAFAGIVFGAARDPVARRIGFWALLIAAAAIMAYTLRQTLPTLSSGWSYAAARTLKGKSFQSGFNINELCFAALVALVAGYPERLIPRWNCAGMLAVTGLCSVLLGARAPSVAVVAGAAAGLLAMSSPVWAACARRRWPGAVATALVTGGVLVLFFSRIDAIAHSSFAAQLAGRAALWQVAVGAWPQQPLFGFGPGTFQDVIHANLGKAHFSAPDEFASLYALTSGGFHNIWLSVLVERGAIGLAGLFVSWCLLVGFALRHGGTLPRGWRFVLITLLVSLFLRGQVELAGLFDDADGPINEIIMLAIGLTFPRFSRPPRAAATRDLAAQAAVHHAMPPTNS